jgi:myo-inositol 2-dehydrogenase/D-chiro-inositol 1-dehydrogenase
MKKIKVGIVGLGRLGKKHAENIAFRVPGAELMAACSIITEEVEWVRRNWGIKYGYTNFYDMLQNKELDAIVIASSSGEHCKQIEAALGAGFHVFCEKPLGISIEECKTAEKAVEKHPAKVFMLGFMRRYDPSYAYAKQKIDEGYIGEPYIIKATSIDPESAIQGVLKYAASSGGIFMDMAVHDIDLIRWYFGDIELDSVYASGRGFLHKEFEKYEDGDNACAMMTFKDGYIAMLHAGRTAPHGYHIETEIIGTKGTLRIGAIPEKNLVSIFNEDGMLKECVSGFLERFEQAYRLEMEEFINCIIEGRKPDITVYDGTKATEIAHAATRSFKEKKLITLR